MADRVTRCPKCSTSFRITDEQLTIAKGAVRCGSCLHVFRAAEHLVSIPVAAPPVLARTATPNVEELSTEEPSTAELSTAELPAGQVRTRAANTSTSATKSTTTSTTTRNSDDELLISDDMDEPAGTHDQGMHLGNEFSTDFLSLQTPSVSLFERDLRHQNKTEQQTSHDESWADDLLGDDDRDDSASDDTNDNPSYDSNLNNGGRTDYSSDYQSHQPKAANRARHKPDTSKSRHNFGAIGSTSPGRDLDDDDFLGEFHSGAAYHNDSDLALTGDDNSLTSSDRYNPNDDAYNSIETQYRPTRDFDPSGDAIFDPSDSAITDDDIDYDHPERSEPRFALAPTEAKHELAEFEAELEDRSYGLRDHMLGSINSTTDDFTLQAPQGGSLLWGSLIMLASLILLGQLAYASFDHLSRLQPFRAYYAMICPHINCQLPELSDHTKIKTHNLVIRSHPRVSNALVVDAIIFNGAAFDQPFPALSLTFSDLNNRVIAHRQFLPDEYLGGEMAGKTIMPKGQPVHLTLEIVDPGHNAVNYRMDSAPVPTSNATIN